MNDELRIFQLMLVSFTKDKLVLEDELERAINKNEDFTKKEVEIKRLLKELVLNDEMVKKWTTYTTEETKEEKS
jgi:hypothetical protein